MRRAWLAESYDWKTLRWTFVAVCASAAGARRAALKHWASEAWPSATWFTDSRWHRTFRCENDPASRAIVRIRKVNVYA